MLAWAKQKTQSFPTLHRQILSILIMAYGYILVVYIYDSRIYYTSFDIWHFAQRINVVGRWGIIVRIHSFSTRIRIHLVSFEFVSIHSDARENSLKNKHTHTHKTTKYSINIAHLYARASPINEAPYFLQKVCLKTMGKLWVFVILQWKFIDFIRPSIPSINQNIFG